MAIAKKTTKTKKICERQLCTTELASILKTICYVCQTHFAVKILDSASAEAKLATEKKLLWKTIHKNHSDDDNIRYMFQTNETILK